MYIKVKNFCLVVLCPVGTRSDPLTESCVDCLPGAYQDEEGQLTCKVCPRNHMTPAGAYNVTQCEYQGITSLCLDQTCICLSFVYGNSHFIRRGTT